MYIIYCLLALAAGICWGIQSSVNSQLSIYLAHKPYFVAFFSYFFGAVVLAILSIKYNEMTDGIWQGLTTVEPWKLIGGILGAFITVVAIYVSPKLGLANMLFLIVLGQLITAGMVDHFAWLHMPHRPLNLAKVIGILFVFLGVVLFFYADRLMNKLN